MGKLLSSQRIPLETLSFKKRKTSPLIYLLFVFYIMTTKRLQKSTFDLNDLEMFPSIKINKSLVSFQGK